MKRHAFGCVSAIKEAAAAVALVVMVRVINISAGVLLEAGNEIIIKIIRTVFGV